MFVILKTITLIKFIVTHCYLSPLFLVLVHQCRKIKWNYYAVNNHCRHQYYCNTMTMNYWGKLFFSVVVFDKKDGPLTPEEEEQRCTTKRKVLGNIRFIGKTYYLIHLNLLSVLTNNPSISSQADPLTVGLVHSFLILWVHSEHIEHIQNTFSYYCGSIQNTLLEFQKFQPQYSYQVYPYKTNKLKKVLWLLSCLVLGELAKYDMLHEAIVHRCIKQVNSCMNENGKLFEPRSDISWGKLIDLVSKVPTRAAFLLTHWDGQLSSQYELHIEHC